MKDTNVPVEETEAEIRVREFRRGYEACERENETALMIGKAILNALDNRYLIGLDNDN